MLHLGKNKQVGGSFFGMAGQFDSIMKRLIREYPEDFVRLVEADAIFVRARNIELQTQHRFADALMEIRLNDKEGLLHFEVQTDTDPEIEERLLEYNFLASRQYRLPTSSYVIYLRDVKDVPQPPFIRRFLNEEEVHRFFYRVIELAQIPAETILQLDWPSLLCLVTLTQGGKEPEVIKIMVDRLAEAQEFDLLAMARVAGGLVFTKEAERDWFRRRFAMYQDILRDSWVYQEIGQEFLEEERQQALQRERQMLISFVQATFPQIADLARQQTEGIQDPEVIQTLFSKLVTAQRPKQAKQILLDINKQ